RRRRRLAGRAPVRHGRPAQPGRAGDRQPAGPDRTGDPGPGAEPAVHAGRGRAGKPGGAVTWLAIGLALLNACCFTAGTWLQHSVSGDAPSLRAAARRPRWQAGLALLTLGAGFQVCARRMAPVTVVGRAGVIGMVVGVRLGRRTRGERLRRSTGWALTMILVGTVAFAVLAALNTAPVPITTEALLSAGAMVAVVVACCRFATRLLHGRARFLVLGVGGGTAYGCTSTLVRAATERYAAHGIGVELLGILVGLAAAILAGFWLVQRAHAEGPPEGTVANLTVVDPLVA